MMTALIVISVLSVSGNLFSVANALFHRKHVQVWNKFQADFHDTHLTKLATLQEQNDLISKNAEILNRWVNHRFSE